MQSKNKIVIAAAGSGKTTYIVEEALKQKKKILIVTFTNNNNNEIIKKFCDKKGYVPSNITISTWYTFLLNELIRPYQTDFFPEERISGIYFRNKPRTFYVEKSDIKRYFLNKHYEIDKDFIADFAEQCIESSGGKVMKRLEEIYDHIFIDEVQDMSAYDLELFKRLFKSRIQILMVGDIRQATFSTSNARKNKQYKGIKMINFFKELEKLDQCTIKDDLLISHRCNQLICDFADSLYPELEGTLSMNKSLTGHDGLYIVNTKKVDEYIERFNPQVLRYNSRTKIEGALNFGVSKGLTFDRVLIKPTKAIESYLKAGNLDFEDTTLAKFYVAVTRARHSVGFITNIRESQIPNIQFL